MGIEDSNAPAVQPAPVLTEYVGQALVTPHVDKVEPIVTPEVAIEATPKELTPEEQAAKLAATGKPEDKMFGAKFAALSRKEKEQRQAMRAFEAEKAAFAKQKADLEAQYGLKEKELSTKYIDPVKFKENPLGLMQEHGLTFEQLAQRVLNDGKPGQEEVLSDAEKRFEAKIAALEAKLEEKTKSDKAREEEANQKMFEERLTAFKAQLTDFCNKESDYEMIRANDAVALVYEVIEEHHQNTMDKETGVGQILSNKEAADAVENYLLEEAKKQMNVNKVKALAAQVVAKAPEGKPSSPTLSNAHSAQPVPSSGQKRLSDDDSRKEAAKLIKWQD